MIKSLSTLAVIFALWGCAPLKPGPEADRPLSPPASIRAEAVVEVKKGAIPLSGRALILARGPESFRIEVFGPFGSTAALLVCDGRSLYVYSGEGEGEVYELDDESNPFSSASRAVASFLLGAAMTKTPEGFTVSESEGKRRFSKDGPKRFTVELSDLRETDGVVLPYSITIEDGGKKRLRIRYSKIAVNPELAREAFDTGTVE